MDLLKIVFSTLKKNIALLVILLISAITVGVVHYLTQSVSYISNFKTNKGLVDYTLFKSLTDFYQISSETYDLSENEIEEINALFLNYKVSFTEETSTSISFTILTKDENGDHKRVQNDILKLINVNRFVQSTLLSDIEIQKKELIYLKERITQLDTLMMNPPSNVIISGIPNDSYSLYKQQLDLEEKIKSTGKFELIKPVTEIKTNKKPVLLFAVLYLVLAGFIFLLLCKKEPASDV